MDTNNPNNKIQIFNNPQFGEVRVYAENSDKPLLCAMDVASALGYSDTADAIARHCKSGKKVFCPHANGVGGTNKIFIPESDVYRLIMRSKLPSAEKFQDWVCEEVLPSIRKHGIYATPHTIEAILADPDFGIRLLTELKEERTMRIEAEKQIKANKHKVIFADAVETSRSSCLVGELAKILKQNGIEIGQNRLFEWLRKNHYLCSQYNQRNIPTQKAMDCGLFEVKKRVVELPDGSVKTVTTTVVTGRGQIYFINKFLNR